MLVSLGLQELLQGPLHVVVILAKFALLVLPDPLPLAALPRLVLGVALESSCPHRCRAAQRPGRHARFYGRCSR